MHEPGVIENGLALADALKELEVLVLILSVQIVGLVHHKWLDRLSRFHFMNMHT